MSKKLYFPFLIKQPKTFSLSNNSILSNLLIRHIKHNLSLIYGYRVLQAEEGKLNTTTNTTTNSYYYYHDDHKIIWVPSQLVTFSRRLEIEILLKQHHKIKSIMMIWFQMNDFDSNIIYWWEFEPRK